MDYSLVALDKKKEAIKTFEKFLELTPDVPLVKQFLEQLSKRT